jgi:hypothetical protein
MKGPFCYQSIALSTCLTGPVYSEVVFDLITALSDLFSVARAEDGAPAGPTVDIAVRPTN